MIPRVQSPSDYVEMMEKSRYGKPIQVSQMQRKFKTSWISKNHLKSVCRRSMKKNAGRKVQSNNAHWFSYEQVVHTCTGSWVFYHDGEVCCRYSHNIMEHSKRVNILKRNFNKVQTPKPKNDGPLERKTFQGLETGIKNLLSRPAMDV